MEFSDFNNAINARFSSMKKANELYRVDISGDDLYDEYLKAFPEGTNPIYKERTNHDCSCCKHFIRQAGNVVEILDNGNLISIWDVDVGDYYQIVADKLSKIIKTKKVVDRFCHYEGSVGTKHNFQNEDGKVIRWDHFYVELPLKHTLKKDEIPSVLSAFRDKVHVFNRGLSEIHISAIEQVLDLIHQKNIYRGEEHLRAINNFLSAKQAFDKSKNKENFVWANVNQYHGSTIRNTVIGTLLLDLSKGISLEKAVKSFEEKVAPANYKRPSALITSRMIEDAEKAVEKLGLTQSLYRRYAIKSDVTVNNVIYADRTVKPDMGNSPFSSLKKGVQEKVNIKNFKNKQRISVQEFINEVVSSADTIELLLENNHLQNLVSLTAPVDTHSQPLFKWSNGFAWSYVGEVTDSIKERVKKAGGEIKGDLRVSLSWKNTDDLDLHVEEPSGTTIYYSSPRSLETGGTLDVDMNVSAPYSLVPVENIIYKNKSKMMKGTYRVLVNQYTKRNKGKNPGFEIEIEHHNKVLNLVYERDVRSSQTIHVADIVFNGTSYTVKPKIRSLSEITKEKWGLSTNKHHRVNMMLFSPNHWDGEGVGNKHYFFVLEGCKQPGKTRGFYNEFLSNNLNKHRKVFELLGSKMMAEPSDEQLSGVGFSSTQHNEICTRVTMGRSNRIFVITF